MKLFMFLFIAVTLYAEKLPTTLVLVTENRQGLVRGWNDLNMLIHGTTSELKVTLIPRDTLVDIPSKGKWTLNSVYLVLNKDLTKRFFEKEFGHVVDSIVILEMEKDIDPVLEIAQKIGLIKNPAWTKSWLRDRKGAVNSDYARLLRINEFLRYVKNGIVKYKLGTIIGFASGFKFGETFKPYAKHISSVEFYIADGQYVRTFFDLRKPNGYVFQSGWKDVFLVKREKGILVETLSSSPYRYCETDYKAKSSNHPVIAYNPSIKRYATNWSGGLTYTGAGF